VLPVKQIMRLKTSSAEVEEMLSSDGEKISGASSVVVYAIGSDKHMLIGTVLTEAYYCSP